MLSVHLSNISARLLIPFSLQKGVALESAVPNEQWEKCARADYGGELDPLVLDAFFNNDFCCLRLKADIQAKLLPFFLDPMGEKISVIGYGEGLDIPIDPQFGIELFLNPQHAGVVSVAIKGGGCNSTQFRRFLHHLCQTFQEDDEIQLSNGQWLSDIIVEWLVGSAAPSGSGSVFPASMTRQRRFLFVGVQLDDKWGPRDSTSSLSDLNPILTALALGLNPRQDVVYLPNFETRILNPFHVAGVYEGGAAHAVIDSAKKRDDNAERIVWVAQTYALLTVHELLYRNSAVSLLSEAREVTKVLATEGRDDDKTQQIGAERANKVRRLSQRLITFQLYGDIQRAGAKQPIRDYHLMVCRKLGGPDNVLRLRQAVTALEQIDSAGRQVELQEKVVGLQEKVVGLQEKVVELQEKVELLEIFIFLYYLIALTHYIFAAFQIPESVTGFAFVILTLVGLVTPFFDDGLRESILKTPGRGFRLARFGVPIFAVSVLFFWGLSRQSNEIERHASASERRLAFYEEIRTSPYVGHARIAGLIQMSSNLFAEAEASERANLKESAEALARSSEEALKEAQRLAGEATKSSIAKADYEVRCKQIGKVRTMPQAEAAWQLGDFVGASKEWAAGCVIPKPNSKTKR